MQGSDAFEPRPKSAHGEFARLFLATGLVPVGKTQLSEFGLSASAEHPRLGAVRNPGTPTTPPARHRRVRGRSSPPGGADRTHANDGGGSIRIPAACNGLVGLKPSRGRLPSDWWLLQMPVKLVTNGVLTRSVRDTAAFYREAELIWRDRRFAADRSGERPEDQRLRIAVVTQSVHRDSSPAVRDFTLQTAALLEGLGHRVEALDHTPSPRSFVDDFCFVLGVLAMTIVRTSSRLLGAEDRPRPPRQPDVGPRPARVRGLHRLPLAIAPPEPAAPGDRAVLPRLRRPADPDPDRRDTPDRAPGSHRGLPADHRPALRWVGFTPLQNVTGSRPSRLPLAQSANGMPVGMMLSAPTGQERRLLELAYELEAARPFPKIQASVQA